MNLEILSLLVLLAPLGLLLSALMARVQPGAQNDLVKRTIRVSTFINFVVAMGVALVVWQAGTVNSLVLGTQTLGISIRLDSLSALMFGMIAILSWVIFRFSFRYLEGDARHGIFLGRMALTVAAVQLLVLAGNVVVLWMAWVGTSLALHQLLVFYRERKKAQMAARKKFIMARMGDLLLAGALVILTVNVGSGQLSEIFAAVNQGTLATSTQEIAALLLVGAALFKSAQFPTHSWLVEVMETPTPVSALLHAGLLNAGPFLITRFAFVMDGTTAGPAVLICIAAFTALFGSAAYLTQPAVKTALGYSSVAHMGFSLLSCGLGVYSAAMLHMVAHSFYKAHSFLSTGSVIDQARAKKVVLPTRLHSPLRMVTALVYTLALYLGVAWVLGIDPLANAALLVVGALVMLGLTQLMTQTMDAKAPARAVVQASVLTLGVAGSFFVLERSLHGLLGSQLPTHGMPTGLLAGLMYSVLAIFALTIMLQILAPATNTHPRWRALGIHLRNGFYANALLDRWIGALRVPTTQLAKAQPEKVRVEAPQTAEELTV